MHGAVAFIGDSLTVGLATSNITPKSENYGIPGDTVEGLLRRLPAYDFSGARAIVLEIGINDWSQSRFSDFADKYRQVLSLLPKSIPIIALTILPINSRAAGNIEFAGAQGAIRQANRDIAAVCQRFPNCRTLDLTDALADQAGSLRPEYEEGDGIHLSAAGYAIWESKLTPILAGYVRS